MIDLQRFFDGRPGHSQAIGLGYRAHGDDWAELTLPARPDLMGAGDWAAGPLFTLADVATAMAIWARRGAIGPQVTLDLRLDRLRAGRGLDLVCRGTCAGVAGELGFVRGVIHEGDPADPLALAAGTFVALA